MALTELSLKGRALRLLGGREYSRVELERRLKRHELAPGLLANVLDELQAKGFISEQRVVASVVHRRSAKLGAARIRRELQDKGLDPDLVREALAGLQDSELARAREVWRKKFGATACATGAQSDLGAVQRAAQMRFLYLRGFSAQTIRQVLGGSWEESSDLPD